MLQCVNKLATILSHTPNRTSLIITQLAKSLVCAVFGFNRLLYRSDKKTRHWWDENYQ